MSSTAPGIAAYAPVPGPVDRVHFLDEQRRHRRKSWRFAVLAVLAVAITGIPLSILVTPLIFVTALLAVHVINLITPLPPGVWERAREVSLLLPAVADRISVASPQNVFDVLALLRDILPDLLVLLVPGALAMLALWLFVLSLFRRAGVGGVLLALGARPPRAGDLEELQLGNLVAEMSIAAGVPPPRLMLLDGHGDNAAAVGSSVDDAAVVVSRRMLDELDRDQTQAVIGHLVGSVGNGDLRIALILLSVYQTFGLMQLLFNTAFGKESRRGVWRIIRYAVLPHPRSAAAAEEGAIAELLARSLTESKDDLGRALDESDSPKRLARIRSYLRFPLVATVGMASITTQFAVMLSSMLLFGPAFAALWRTRRFLADAMAVQLTRNPTALAGALDALGERATLVRGGESVALLFAVRLQEAPATPAKTEFFDSYHPRVGKRLNRLIRLGAGRWQRRPPPATAATPAGTSTTEPSAPRPKPSAVGNLLRVALVAVLSVILVPLMVAAFALSLVALSMMMMLTLMFMTIMLAATHALLAWLFGLAGAEFRR